MGRGVIEMEYPEPVRWLDTRTQDLYEE